ncbi:MAG: hypothetical protein NC548_48805 [Lachnospiraceae bacterium]|nr:hypothetical protein [Lachnospiraceae bacterium]
MRRLGSGDIYLVVCSFAFDAYLDSSVEIYEGSDGFYFSFNSSDPPSFIGTSFVDLDNFLCCFSNG